LRVRREVRAAVDPFWRHIVIAAVIFAAVTLLARVIDWSLTRRPLAPEAATRYRIFRRTVTVIILTVGLFSALLAIPEVRAVAGGLLASSALLGVVLGFAAQRTLGNFVAGILIALAQPVRIGDRVEYGGASGVVEEIGLTYTFIRAIDRRRIVVPNEKLASDMIVNASIRSRETFAEVSVPVPLTADLDGALDVLRDDVASERDADVYVTSLDGQATVTVRAAATDEVAAEHLEHDLRLRAHRRLRALGVWT
jgi:small-conductance mechanosensitive channel